MVSFRSARFTARLCWSARNKKVGLLSVAMLVTVAVGCDDSNAGVDYLEDPSTCTAGWRPLTAAQPWDSISSIAYQGGYVFYAANSAQTLNAVSVADGQTRVLAAGYATDLWVEGDHLLYAQGNQFLSLPLVGGAPQLLLDFGAERANTTVSVLHAFTPTDFVWAELDLGNLLNGPTTVRRAGRPDGAPVTLGSATAHVPGSNNVVGYQNLALTGDSVLLQSDFGVADVVPLAGGAARSLPAPTASINILGPAGVDVSGAYWSVLQSDTASDSWGLALSPADGSPAREFWRSGLPHSSIGHTWPNGKDGWVMTGTQAFRDRIPHTTIWLLDADGLARRLACSPGDSQEAWIDRRVAVAPDAVYAVTKNLTVGTWQIDRIAR